MVSNKKLKQFLFWKGQYASRNPEFIRLNDEEWAAIDAFVEATPEEEDYYWRNSLFEKIESLTPLDLLDGVNLAQRNALNEAREKHRQRKTLFPVAWDYKEEALDIIDAVISESFPQYFEGKLYSDFSLKVSDEKLTPLISPLKNPWVEQIKSEGEIIDIRIAVDGNMAEILESVRLLILMARINQGDSQWRQDLKKSLHGGRRGYSREVLNSLKEESPSAPIQRLHNRARAIGLWLYDQVKKTGEQNLAEHCRYLRTLSQFAPLGFSSSEDSVFRRHYSRTCECIQAGEVLPFG